MIEAAVGVAVIVYFIVLLFAVLKIRDAIESVGRANARMLALLEAVVPDGKKPKPAPKPKEVLIDGQMMRVCPHCGANNYFQDAKCTSCKAQLIAN